MSTPLAGRLTRVAVALASVILLARCADPLPTEGVDPTSASLAKGGGGGGGKPGGGGSTDVKVTAADPDYGQQGDVNEEIVISGSGFIGDESGNVAVAWERNGVADPKITVHSAAVINSSTIRARISIAEDAELGYYDIAVQLLGPGGKRGVGTEMFEVTTAQPIQPLCTSQGSANIGRGASVQGEVVGGSCGQAFYWDGAVTHSLGTGFAIGIDDNGLVIAGGTGDIAGSTGGLATVWLRSGGASTRSHLPVPSTGGTPWSGRANVVASNSDGDAVFIGGRIDEPQKRKNTYIVRPALWTRDGTQPSGWRLLPSLPAPPGTSPDASRSVTGVSAGGVAVGRFSPAAAWVPDDNGGYISYILGTGEGQTWGISPDGNVIVGNASFRAAYWKRDNGQGWSGPHYLHESCGTTSNARAENVNRDHVMVGWNCTRAMAWKLNADGSVTEIVLPGLGKKQTAIARGISNGLAGGAGARVVGESASSPVYWDLMH